MAQRASTSDLQPQDPACEDNSFLANPEGCGPNPKGKYANRKLLTIPEFIEIYGGCRATFYNLRNSGAFPTYRRLGRTVVRVEDAERWYLSLPMTMKNQGGGRHGD